MAYNDIHFVADEDVLIKLKHNIDDFLEKEVLIPYSIPADQSFIKTHLTQNGLSVQYNLYPTKAFLQKTPVTEQGGPIRDPEDITRYYLREVLDNVRYVSYEDWQEINKTNLLLATEYNGRINDKEHTRLNLEVLADFEKKGMKMFDTMKISPDKLKNDIKQAENGLRWVINECLQEHPEMEIYFKGPYQQTLVIDDLQHEYWVKKYPEFVSINTLLYQKENQATVKTALKR